MDPQEKISVGDIVELKSGGPRMTVAEIANYHGTVKAVCVWFLASEKSESIIALPALKKSSG